MEVFVKFEVFDTIYDREDVLASGRPSAGMYSEANSPAS
jgi:hypothetical protein